MGVNLGDLVPRTPINLHNLSGGSLAIDAYNALYQFLAIIRQPDGTPLMDSRGRITSHLSGLLYRTANLVEMNIKPVYVFDGTPPAPKEAQIERRTHAKVKATIKYRQALKRGRLEEARTYAQATSRLENYMTEDSKHLLTLMGIPWVQAPSEGEAQAAHLVKQGATDFCASQDYDSLLFGAPKLVRNVTISGRRKLPRKRIYLEVTPEIVELLQVLDKLGVTQQQLVDISILVGTDYNPGGVKGIGPKTALKLIREHGTLENVLSNVPDAEFPVPPQDIRSIFLNPKVTDDYSLQWEEPDSQAVIDFMCGSRDFTEERVRRALARMIDGMKGAKGRITLEKWFKN